VTARLAHLNALRAFEVTARLGSYVRAADELSVTPAAVGQQVRMLEEHIGSALFTRRGKKLVLTEAASAVLPEIKDAFDRLTHATNRLRRTRRVDLVTITLPPSLTKWLIPRIDTFTTAHPEVDLRLEPADRLADLLREDITLAIRYGTGRYPGLDATLLMADEVFPVCSPSLLTRTRKLREPDDLANFRLIHDTSMDSHRNFPTWATWLEAAGGQRADARRGLRVNSPIMALQAAIDGQGVALARSVTAADDLREGRIIRPFRLACATSYSYYMLYPTGLPLSQAASAFCRWLENEVKEFEKKQHAQA
jgi:LysR family transcriptional regulator, glycine cleavage system transcriptional activator